MSKLLAKHSRRSKGSKPTIPPVNKEINTENDAEAQKANRFTNIKAALRDQMWQFWGFLLSFLVVLASIIGYLVGLSGENKLYPLSVPDNFVSFSNPDFAVSFPYTINQNKSFSARTYGFDLDGTEKNPRFLQVSVMEGKEIQPNKDASSDSEEEVARTREEMKKVMSNLGGSNATINLLSYETDSFQGNKGNVIVWEAYTKDEETQESEYLKIKMRMFFNEKTKRFYQIVYTPDPSTEQILSTINFSKSE